MKLEKQFNNEKICFGNDWFMSFYKSEIKLMTGQKSEYKNEEKVPKGEIPVHRLKKIEKSKKDELKWIWFGHLSPLLEIEGMNVLMEPVFSNYTSPISFIGPKRFSKLPQDHKRET